MDTGSVSSSDINISDQFGEIMRQILLGRLTYFLGEIPKQQLYDLVRMEESEDRLHMRFMYDSVTMLHVDLSNSPCIRFGSWDRTTREEIIGTATGPGAFQLEHAPVLEKYMYAFDATIEYVEPYAGPEPSQN